MEKMLEFYVKVSYVMVKELSGELSCTRTGLVSQSKHQKSSFIQSSDNLFQSSLGAQVKEYDK